ncbi:hypothetical protein BOTNAR_0396g00070 [Botryotinia narcissicola]|uniref:Uncharacterized protein n=1 Tax=Botryotinia narcissicola TaxID=278944 RepID=A0A4Z1I033_9HELO|nr:hypothetical protein BOTNAR_0396g00070 [Botryotinia narcissicola]
MGKKTTKEKRKKEVGNRVLALTGTGTGTGTGIMYQSFSLPPGVQVMEIKKLLVSCEVRTEYLGR